MKVLITGATGMVGKALAKKLLSLGEEVCILSRSKKDFLRCKVYQWDYKKNYLEKGALDGVDAIIHLAGATVSEKWSDAYKKIIIDSRVETANLLFDKCKETESFPKTYISASGSSYYGQVTQDVPFKEVDCAGKDFIAKVAEKWEASADKFDQKSRVVKIRTGLVLSLTGGVLERLLPMAKRYILSPVGSGAQYYPWVHVDDLVDVYIAALNKNVKGSFNAAAPVQTSNTEFTNAIANAAGKKVVLPNVPAFVLKLVFGEMSKLLLMGSPLDGEKTEKQLHKYRFKDIDECFKHLIKTKS